MPDRPKPSSTIRKPTFRHRAQYLAYRVVVGVLQVVPERLAFLFGEGMGWVVGVCFRIRWRTVIEHLSEAFPEQDAKWCRAQARASFRHLGRQSVATFRLGKMGVEEVRRRTDVPGFEALKEAVAQGHGVIVATGHMGNWEVGGASVVAHGIPMGVVVQRQRNPLFDIDITGNRTRLGLTIIDRREAPRQVIRALRKGRAVGIAGDQNIRRGGVFVEFFGRQASTARGTALFALRTGAPIFLMVVNCLPGIPQRYRVSFERVNFTPSGDMDLDVLRVTEAYMGNLEKWIRKSPEEYLWQHRRWKTRPPVEG